jgi:hypothetical protein
MASQIPFLTAEKRLNSAVFRHRKRAIGLVAAPIPPSKVERRGGQIPQGARGGHHGFHLHWGMVISWRFDGDFMGL